MVNICNNTKVRLPTVNILLPAGSNGLPNIIPGDASSAALTSDGFSIGCGPYLLTFILPASIGSFKGFSATFTPTTTGGDPSLIFIPCNMINNAANSGLNNYLMYIVMNGVFANNQPKGTKQTFNYKVKYSLNGSSVPKGKGKSEVIDGITFYTDNSGSIENDGQD